MGTGRKSDLRRMRSNAEGHLYMELQPCPCGARGFDADSAVISVEDELAARYTGNCPECGRHREYVFLLPAEPTLRLFDELWFGADEPSELLDAGDWLWLSDRLSNNIPPRPDGMDAQTRLAAWDDLRTAAAAVSEVMKFVPAGQDRVPPSAFWSEESRATHRESPHRFDRARLEVLRQTYQEMATRFTPGGHA